VTLLDSADSTIATDSAVSVDLTVTPVDDPSQTWLEIASCVAEPAQRTASVTVTIPASQGQAGFFFSSTVPGSWTLTATSAESVAPGFTTTTVGVGSLGALIVEGPSSLAVGQCGAYRIEFEDGFGNPTAAGGDLTLAAASGSFFDGTDCAGTAVSSIPSASLGSYHVVSFVEGKQDLVSPLTLWFAVGATQTDWDVAVGHEPAVFPGLAADLGVELADVAVQSSLIIYTTTADGYVHESTNGGSSWTVQCRFDDSGAAVDTRELTLDVSPAADATAYLTYQGQLLRVEDARGAPCPNKSPPNAAAELIRHHSARAIAIDANGTLYAYTGRLWSSQNRGDSWASAVSADDGITNTAWLAIDASRPERVVVVRADASSQRDAIRTTNGGVTWSPLAGLPTDPAHIRLVGDRGYHPGGAVSTDGGATWSADSAYEMSDSWAANGVTLYSFFPGAPGTTYLQSKQPAGAWSLVESFPGLTYATDADFQSRLDVSVAVAMVAAVVDGSLTINGGATNSVGPTQQLAAVAALDVSGAAHVYAVTSDWQVLRSLDGGGSWSLVDECPGTCDGLPRVQARENDAGNATVVVWSDSDDYLVISSSSFVASPYRFSNQTLTWATALAMSPEYSGPIYVVGEQETFRIDNEGDATPVSIPHASTNLSSLPPIAWVYPTNTDEVWLLTSGGVKQVDFGGPVSVIDHSVGALPAGLEMRPYQSDYEVCVISRTGTLRCSPVASFALPSFVPGPLTSCAPRDLRTLPTSSAEVATACMGGDEVAVSQDAGATWREVTINGCTVRSIALPASGRLQVACANRESVVYRY
jgi:hypothetical protein